jgi:hypothetical protein
MDDIVRPLDDSKGLLVDSKGPLLDFKGSLVKPNGRVLSSVEQHLHSARPLLSTKRPHVCSVRPLLSSKALLDAFRGLRDPSVADAITTNPARGQPAVIKASSAASTMSNMPALGCFNCFHDTAVALFGHSAAETVCSAPHGDLRRPDSMYAVRLRDRSKGALGQSVQLLLCSKGPPACSTGAPLDPAGFHACSARLRDCSVAPHDSNNSPAISIISASDSPAPHQPVRAHALALSGAIAGWPDTPPPQHRT